LKRRVIIESRGAAETRRLGKLMGQRLTPGSVVALSGELGSGKTQLIKGLAVGLGVDTNYHVSSPSFVLINEYPGRTPLYHVDLYRLSNEKDLEEIGLEEYLYGKGVTAIEWAEKACPFIPSQHIWIDMEWTGLKTRKLVIKAVGKDNVQVLEPLGKKPDKAIS
jgi:tRNA threonylcarbamoyladenosine biosynthesis protein TsaE